MECPICKQEMIEGKVQIYEMGSVILHRPVTMKFVPNDKGEKTVKTVSGGQYQKIQGYRCEKCNKIVSIAPIQKLF